MRQVLTWRFVAALGALVGLALLVGALLLGRDTVARVVDDSGPGTRRIDLSSIVLETESSDFALRRDGFTRGELTLQLATPVNRSVTIYPGTPGAISCDELDQSGRCALFAQTLGDTIVWFAFVPMNTGFRAELPAIDDFVGDHAELVNGWQVPYAPVIDRDGCETPAESFSEFLSIRGKRFKSVYSFGPGEITAVVC